jgi:broad specificity phosphatase PhoE
VHYDKIIHNVLEIGRNIMSETKQNYALPAPCTFILVRHGETASNVQNTFRGRTDVTLNETGVAQAQAVAARIKRKWQPVALYASPVIRAMQTAQFIGESCKLTPTPYPDIIDIDFGQWTGLTFDEVKQHWPEELDNWIAHPGETHIPGGESIAEMHLRARQALGELSERHSGQTVILVGHTVINRVLIMETLNIPDDCFWYIGQDTCALNLIRAEVNGQYSLLRLNDTCHLEKNSLEG